jgi:hypothetical protein
MATFTEWMRLGEARMTPFATLALGAAMAWIAPQGAEAAVATAERTVSGVRISLGEEGRRWTLVPTMLDGKVESFLALREDLAYGENLTAVWYRKSTSADGAESWETKAFEDQDQSKAIRAVKNALSLADATDGSWPAPVAPVAAAAPESLVKGVLETDALAPLVADLDDPQPLVEMLEGAGWKAAWIGPLEGVAVATAEPDAVACPQAAVLAALASGVDADPSGGADAEAVAFAKLQTCWSICLKWTWEGTPTCTGCTAIWTLCGTGASGCPAGYAGEPAGSGRTDPAQCAVLCWFEGTLSCAWTRTNTKRNWDCTRCTWTQTGTTSETIYSKSTKYFNIGGQCNMPAPGAYTCPASPDNPNPGCDSPHQTQRPAGWIPGPPC